MSTITFSVIVFANCHPFEICFAVVPSCARANVNVSPTTRVTRTISAFACTGSTPGGHTVQLNGATGNKAPCPACNVSVVPETFGAGGVRTMP
jgi:hypothetical protein